MELNRSFPGSRLSRNTRIEAAEPERPAARGSVGWWLGVCVCCGVTAGDLTWFLVCCCALSLLLGGSGVSLGIGPIGVGCSNDKLRPCKK